MYYSSQKNQIALFDFFSSVSGEDMKKKGIANK
jgi:hypothetical protein